MKGESDMEIGEEYFYPCWSGQYTSIRHIQVVHARWTGSVNDYGRKALGIIYKTNKECRENLRDDFLRVTGREL